MFKSIVHILYINPIDDATYAVKIEKNMIDFPTIMGHVLVSSCGKESHKFDREDIDLKLHLLDKITTEQYEIYKILYG